MITVFEIINSSRIHVYCGDRVPTIQVDGCEGVQIHLKEASTSAKIVTCKSTEVNVEFPNETGETCLIPSQFESTIEKGKLITKPTELE